MVERGDTMEMATIQTKPCFLCNMGGEVTVPAAELEAWDGGRGPFIQVAMPTTSAEIREQILTGTHPECWAAMFPEEEE